MAYSIQAVDCSNESYKKIIRNCPRCYGPCWIEFSKAKFEMVKLKAALRLMREDGVLHLLIWHLDNRRQN
jgi:hypothetical protein